MSKKPDRCGPLLVAETLPRKHFMADAPNKLLYANTLNYNWLIVSDKWLSVVRNKTYGVGCVTNEGAAIHSVN